MNIKKEDLEDDGLWRYDEDLGRIRSGPRGNRYWDAVGHHYSDPIASLNAIGRFNARYETDRTSIHSRVPVEESNPFTNPYRDPRRLDPEQRTKLRELKREDTQAVEPQPERRDAMSGNQSTENGVDSGVEKRFTRLPSIYELPLPTPPEPRERRPGPRAPTPEESNEERASSPPPRLPPADCICPIHLDCDVRDPRHIDCRQLVPVQRRWRAAQAQPDPWA
jgi:hypothetical protein